MKLRFVVNWIGDFLEQLHTNVAEQLVPIVDDPTAPRTRARVKTFLHPGNASAYKPRFVFSRRFGFDAKPVTQIGEGTAIARSCQADPNPNHPLMVRD
jgi:hypothetical protein